MAIRLFCLFLVCVCIPAVAQDTPVPSRGTLTLLGDKQLTTAEDGTVTAAAISPDGRTVACVIDKDNVAELCLVKTNGGRPTITMTGESMSTDDDKDAQPAKGELWNLYSPIVWSPNGQSFALPASRSMMDGAKTTQKDLVVVLPASADSLTVLAVPEGTEYSESLSYAGNSQNLAAIFEVSTDKIPRKCEAVVYDLAKKSSRTVYTEKDCEAEVEGWSDQGRVLLISTTKTKGDRLRLHKIVLSSVKDEVVSTDYLSHFRSPNGKYYVVANKAGLDIRKMHTDESLGILPVSPADFLGWLPNSGILLYKQSCSASGESVKQGPKPRSLWVADVESGEPNGVCVAPDSDDHTPLTWSSDCTKLAYLYQGQLHVAQLK